MGAFGELLKVYWGDPNKRPSTLKQCLPKITIVKTDMTLKEYKNIQFGRAEYLRLEKKKWMITFAIIARCVPADFEKIYGKHNFTYKGEYNAKCWVFDYDGGKFLVASANGRGTTVEASDIKDVYRVERFADALLESMRNTEGVVGAVKSLRDVRDEILKRRKS